MLILYSQRPHGSEAVQAGRFVSRQWAKEIIRLWKLKRGLWKKKMELIHISIFNNLKHKARRAFIAVEITRYVNTTPEVLHYISIRNQFLSFINSATLRLISLARSDMDMTGLSFLRSDHEKEYVVQPFLLLSNSYYSGRLYMI